MKPANPVFTNDPISDFSVEKNRKAMRDALTVVDEKVRGGKYRACPIVDGKERQSKATFTRHDPSDLSIALGVVECAGKAEVDEAFKSLEKGKQSWTKTPARERAKILRSIAERMRLKRFELAALMVRECGKPWREADADVAEAIDFCVYYADQMDSLAEPRRTAEVLGEDNTYFYKPRGIAVVIGPWNFPLAIPCGMLVAALVTGNAAILKPAEQSSLIAYELAKIVLECGVPANAFAFLPGYGEEIGPLLTSDARVDLICFTGSKAVGLAIIENAAHVPSGQTHVKRVIAEMGGKNAIIVDEDADLDETIKGVLYSAFGFSGQKCSACSRLIVVGSAYEPLMARLTEAAADLLVGEARDSSVFFGPVVDTDSQKRILGIIEEAKRNATLAFEGKAPTKGAYVPAVIFRDVHPDSKLWREEVFGPVLACLKADSFEHGLSLANDSEYALTGGVFSRSPKHIDLAKQEFAVGNLYINRGCTGALVCRHPFGGFKMSGVGSKAGGPDYLIQFVEPRVVSENVVRRGVTPELVKG